MNGNGIENGNGNGFGYNNNTLSSLPSEKKLPPIPGVPEQPNDLSHHTTTAGKAAMALAVSPAPSTNSRIGIATPASPSGYQQPPTPPPKAGSSSVSSTAKSFSTGSFFQSLRRISLSTLAQAGVFGATSTSPPGSSASSGVNSGIIDTASSTTTTTSPHPIQVHVNTSNHSIERPSSVGSSPVSPISVSTQRKQQQQSASLVSNPLLPPSSVSSTAGSTTESITVGSRQEIEALVKQPQSLRCCMTFVNMPWTGIVTLLMNHAYSVELNAANAAAATASTATTSAPGIPT